MENNIKRDCGLITRIISAVGMDGVRRNMQNADKKTVGGESGDILSRSIKVQYQVIAIYHILA
jgi:hypothetical protein